MKSRKHSSDDKGWAGDHENADVMMEQGAILFLNEDDAVWELLTADAADEMPIKNVQAKKA